MCSDHGEAVSWQVVSAHGEGDEAGEVPGHKVLQRDTEPQVHSRTFNPSQMKREAMSFHFAASVTQAEEKDRVQRSDASHQHQ